MREHFCALFSTLVLFCALLSTSSDFHDAFSLPKRRRNDKIANCKKEFCHWTNNEHRLFESYWIPACSFNCLWLTVTVTHIIYLAWLIAAFVQYTRLYKIVYFYPRDAMLARVIAIATCPSVRLSVRLSVTRRYCVKTKKASGMISPPPQDSSFLTPNFITKF